MKDTKDEIIEQLKKDLYFLYSLAAPISQKECENADEAYLRIKTALEQVNKDDTE